VIEVDSEGWLSLRLNLIDCHKEGAGARSISATGFGLSPAESHCVGPPKTAVPDGPMTRTSTELGKWFGDTGTLKTNPQWGPSAFSCTLATSVR